MKKKTAVIFFTLLLGAVIFAFVLDQIGIDDLAENFRVFAFFPFLAYMLVSFFMMALSAYRWKVVLSAHGYDVGFWNLFSYRLSGFSLSYITPGALIGGEALRAYLLRRENVDITHGISSVIIDKFFDLVLAALLTSAGFIIIISFFSISDYYKAVFLLVTVAWVVVLSFFIYGALTRKGFFKHIFKFLRLHRVKKLSNIEHKIEETESHISHFFIHHKKEFRRCAVISFVLWLMMFVEYKIATTVFGYDAGLMAVFLIICMVGFSYIFPVPGALGVLEATQASMHLFIGLKAAQGIALSFLIRARDLFWVVIGVFSLYHHGINIAKEIEKERKI